MEWFKSLYTDSEELVYSHVTLARLNSFAEKLANLLPQNLVLVTSLGPCHWWSHAVSPFQMFLSPQLTSNPSGNSVDLSLRIYPESSHVVPLLFPAWYKVYHLSLLQFCPSLPVIFSLCACSLQSHPNLGGKATLSIPALAKSQNTQPKTGVGCGFRAGGDRFCCLSFSPPGSLLQEFLSKSSAFPHGLWSNWTFWLKYISTVINTGTCDLLDSP